jgi:hypothetical protein
MHRPEGNEKWRVKRRRRRNLTRKRMGRDQE